MHSHKRGTKKVCLKSLASLAVMNLAVHLLFIFVEYEYGGKETVFP